MTNSNVISSCLKFRSNLRLLPDILLSDDSLVDLLSKEIECETHEATAQDEKGSGQWTQNLERNVDNLVINNQKLSLTEL